MFIFKSTQKRANMYASYTDAAGTRYNTIPVDLIEEIPDPQPPADYTEDTYYRTEQEDAPYVIFTKKSDEQLQRQTDDKALQAAKDHLVATDYLFTVDKNAQLDEVRKAELIAARELSRQVIRDYDAKYPKETAPVDAVDILP